MNTWLKIKNKIYAEKLSEIDGLFNLIESNSSWSANLQSWASRQKFNKYNSLALSLSEYHEVNKNLIRINEELFHELRNKEAVCSFKEEFKRYYKILLNQKENSLKLEVAAELVEENKLSLDALPAWYSKNKNLTEKEFKEAVGEFLGDVWKGARRGGGYGALGGAAAGGLSTGGVGALGGAALGGGAGLLGGAAYGGGKHLLNRFLNWQKTRNTSTSPVTGGSSGGGSSGGGSPNYSTLNSGGGSDDDSSSSKAETPPDYKNQTEFEKVKKEALAVLQKLKQYSTNLETDTNFNHLLDTIIEKLGGDKVQAAPVPDKNFQAQVAPPTGGSSFDTGMQNTGGSHSFDTSSIHALPGAPPAASGSAAATPKSAASGSAAATPKSAASGSAAATPAPKPKPTASEIPPDIKSPQDILDYLNVPDEPEMNKRLAKIGAWLHMIDKHANHADIDFSAPNLKMLNKFLMSGRAYGDAGDNKKYGEAYKKHLEQKLTHKPAAPAKEPEKTEPKAAEPTVASTNPAVTSAATNPMPDAPKAVKKADDPHGLIKKPMRQMKQLLKDLHFLRDGKLQFTDEEIGKPGSEERKAFIIRYELPEEIKQKAISDKELSQTETTFADKVKFYKEALRGL